jgi:UDP-2,3-diacylglucosamine hydrolase
LLLISDLHLHHSRPDITSALCWFLQTIAPDSKHLYILGDLFEAWIGDDAADPLGDLVATELRQLSNQGTAIYLMHGNRDFLIGKDFATRCGATLVEEPLVFDVDGRKFALLHGDVLCTRDTDYLEFRRMVRNPEWQNAFLAQSVAQRQEFAVQARKQSKQATASTSATVMDVTEAAVTEMFQRLQIDTMIHGHTHRPAEHEIVIADGGHKNRRPRRRIVLGDWDRRGWYGHIDEHGNASLHKFNLAQQ